MAARIIRLDLEIPSAAARRPAGFYFDKEMIVGIFEVGCIIATTLCTVLLNELQIIQVRLLLLPTFSANGANEDFAS